MKETWELKEIHYITTIVTVKLDVVENKGLSIWHNSSTTINSLLFHQQKLSSSFVANTLESHMNRFKWNAWSCLVLFGTKWKRFCNFLSNFLFFFSQKIVCWNMARGWYWSLNCDDSRMRCIRSFVLHSGNVEIEWSVPDNFYLSLNILEFFRLKCHEQPVFIDLLRFIKKNEEQRSVW